MKYLLPLLCCTIFLALAASAQTSGEKIDSAAFAQIRDEGMNRSGVMEIESYLADVYGPRLTGSPGYVRAADWAVSKLASLGLANAHTEKWGPFGRGWDLKRYSANVIGHQNFPLFSYPKAWSPGTGGTQTGEVIYFDATTDSALATYKGKLKGKFVLLSDPRDIKAHFLPEATRDADSTLLDMANADMPQARRGGGGGGGGGRRQMDPAAKARAIVDFEKLEMCQKEGALALLTISRGDGGNIFVQQASVPAHPDTPFTKRVSAWDPNAPKILPQIAVAAEHYNRLIRMIKKGESPKIEMNLEVSFNKADSVANIFAELPGTDLKDEVVMIGGHFDSWHGGTGATDDGTGSAVCMEAMRILKTLKFSPRRTIRIGLWGGEEQGLLGSAGYVKQHFGETVDGKVTQKPENEKLAVYFNNDNGSGKVRGVYMQGNDQVRPIFRSWLKPFKDMDASTLSLSNTGGTDHLSFDAVGIPGFQFIQDPLEYDTRTHHSTMDVYERVQEDDLKQASVIMAAFAYQAAMRDEKFPRKPLPQPTRAPGSN